MLEHIALVFVITALLGIFLEKFRVPWIFSALLGGILFQYFVPSFHTAIFSFGSIGMYFMLFLVGFELDLEKIKKKL